MKIMPLGALLGHVWVSLGDPLGPQFPVPKIHGSFGITWMDYLMKTPFYSSYTGIRVSAKESEIFKDFEAREKKI